MTDGPTPMQVVLCDGPRCRAHGRSSEHWAHLQARLAAEPALQRWVCTGHYACLGRCSAGPNLIVRPVPSVATADPAPGMLDLAHGLHFAAVDTALLDRILDAQRDGAPLPQPHQRYG